MSSNVACSRKCAGSRAVLAGAATRICLVLLGKISSCTANLGLYSVNINEPASFRWAWCFTQVFRRVKLFNEERWPVFWQSLVSLVENYDHG